jgi:hypothetical protein
VGAGGIGLDLWWVFRKSGLEIRGAECVFREFSGNFQGAQKKGLVAEPQFSGNILPCASCPKCRL